MENRQRKKTAVNARSTRHGVPGGRAWNIRDADRDLEIHLVSNQLEAHGPFRSYSNRNSASWAGTPRRVSSTRLDRPAAAVELVDGTKSWKLATPALRRSDQGPLTRDSPFEESGVADPSPGTIRRSIVNSVSSSGRTHRNRSLSAIAAGSFATSIGSARICSAAACNSGPGTVQEFVDPPQPWRPDQSRIARTRSSLAPFRGPLRYHRFRRRRSNNRGAGIPARKALKVTE